MMAKPRAQMICNWTGPRQTSTFQKTLPRIRGTQGWMSILREMPMWFTVITIPTDFKKLCFEKRLATILGQLLSLLIREEKLAKETTILGLLPFLQTAIFTLPIMFGLLKT